MGQRLNLEFQANGEALANAYYHWSGYTTTAVDLAAKAVRAWDRLGKVLPYPSISPQIIRAVLALEATGAEIAEDEIGPALQRLVSEYMDAVRSGEIILDKGGVRMPDSAIADNFIRKIKAKLKAGNKNVNRNDGLICCSKDGMSETQNWAEATVIIDVYYRTVDISLSFATFESVKEYAYIYDYTFTDDGNLLDENGELINLIDYPYDVVINFEDMNTVAKYLSDHEGEDFRYNGTVYSYIY